MLMKGGTRKTQPDHRDYDVKSFGSTLSPHQLPDEFLLDPSIWMPNQEITQAITGIPTIPALPYGCTDYTQTDLCMDEDGSQLDPMLLENITHANARGGTDIRTALDAAKKVFGRTAYFTIKPSGIIDSFDAARLAMYSGQPEKRAVSVGSIWYPQWEVSTTVDGILVMPPELRLDGPWHNWAVCGWVTKNGVQYLKGKSWQGIYFGDNGYHYISRDVFNSIMSMPGTAMFTLSKTAPGQIVTVDLSWVETIVSYILMLYAKTMGRVAGMVHPYKN